MASLELVAPRGFGRVPSQQAGRSQESVGRVFRRHTAEHVFVDLFLYYFLFLHVFICFLFDFCVRF